MKLPRCLEGICGDLASGACVTEGRQMQEHSLWLLDPRDGHSPACKAGLAQGYAQRGDPLSLPGGGRAEGAGMWMGHAIWGSPHNSPSHPVTLHVPFTQLGTEFTRIHTCVPAHGQGAHEPSMG